MDLSRAFRQYHQPVAATVVGQGAYVNGVWIPGSETVVVYEMAVIQLSAKTVKFLPDGLYDTRDIACYHKGAAILKELDRVSISSKEYFVKEINDRQHGEYTKYMCKYVIPDVAT